MRHLTKQFLAATSTVDGKLMRSWRMLLTGPGQLTAAYIKGQRRRYITPLALFFIANAVFVAMQSVTGVNVLSSPLSSHLHSQDWSAFAQSIVRDRLVQRHLTLEAYAPVFDRVALFNAKTLIILMALAFTPLPAGIFRGQHQAAGVHIVFALHGYAFILIILSVAVLLAKADIMLGGEGLSSGPLDTVLSILNLLACGGYLYLAIPKVYSATERQRRASAIVMTLAMALLFVGYRFVIFLITFAAT